MKDERRRKTKGWFRFSSVLIHPSSFILPERGDQGERTASVSNAHDSLAATAEAAARVLARHAADVDAAGRWPGESVTALAEAGLLGLTVPAGLGGLGAGPA